MRENGNFYMKVGTKENEMLCVSIDQTNILVDQIKLGNYKDFSNNFVITKHVKNNCIYVELSEKKEEVNKDN